MGSHPQHSLLLVSFQSKEKGGTPKGETQVVVDSTNPAKMAGFLLIFLQNHKACLFSSMRILLFGFQSKTARTPGMLGFCFVKVAWSLGLTLIVKY